MIKRVFSGFAAAMVLTAGANAAHYVEIQAPTSVDVGTFFDVNIMADFQSLGFIAGGVQLNYDSAVLAFDSFNTALGVDLDLSCPGAALCPADPAGVFSIVWGQFLSDLIAPDAGPTLIGTVRMFAADTGSSPLELMDFTDFTGGWFGTGFSPIDAPELRSSSVAVVPLPAAVWMLIGGLGLLARYRRS